MSTTGIYERCSERFPRFPELKMSFVMTTTPTTPSFRRHTRALFMCNQAFFLLVIGSILTIQE
ncbi:hypothetical protein CPB83DRAFT_849745 [Crepidotus variabilis]|uniref:Uncharacterized protein n=1 Tax=Crepidotus variabilis TaxID=179855 RepID=A0A9P6JRJ1_9AGAR|nr:hypothetical protein CPB83DRAFT_849745 [Crepidotus variabilis]